MSTLKEIKEMTARVFPEARHDLPHMIWAWLSCDPGQELEKLISSAGGRIAGVLNAYEPLLHGEPDPEDMELLMACITNPDRGEPTGFHVWRAICEKSNSRLCLALSGSGMNVLSFSDVIAAKIAEMDAAQKKSISNGTTVKPIEGPMLEYGRDLAMLARDGAFDGLCDRPAEIEALLDVLLRRQKANPALTGPAGVGKTCLVELLAARIVRGEITCLPPGTHIFELSMGKVVAGTKYRGDFEDRLYRILDAVEKQGDIILFIDEMHILWGAGAAEGVTTNASNILKPYLARERLKVIGVTTHEEYELYIRMDPALERRFQEIKLRRPGGDLMRDMILKQSHSLEGFHGIAISRDLALKAMELADRYVPNRNQPDKSVDLLDSSAAHARRRGRQVLSLTDILDTLCALTGKRIKAPEEEQAWEWIESFHNGLKQWRCDVIPFGEPDEARIKRLLTLRLSEMMLPLYMKNVDLVFDGKRLVDYLYSEMTKDDSGPKGIIEVINRRVLEPVARLIIKDMESKKIISVFLEDEFYLTGTVRHTGYNPLNRVREKVMDDKVLLSTN